MKHKLVLLGALVAIIGVFAARVPAEAATEPFSATYAITFTACTSGGTCNGNGTIDAGEPVGTSVHTSLDSAGGAFYDAVESVQSGVIPQTGVPAGDTVGTGSFLIHVTAGARCNPAGGFINPSYTIYATNDLNNTGTYPSLGYAKGLTGSETWSTFSAAGWIQDFDDDNNNNIPDSVEGGSGASTLPMTVRQTISAGKPDGAFKEPLYLPLLDQIVGATHTTRAFGDAVVAAGVSEVPVDFVNYVGIPSAGQTTQFAVINEGGGLGLLPASPGGASIQTCPPFTSDISVNALSSSGAIVQKADVGGSYQYQIQISTAPDFDGDGIPNGEDNCPQVANATQTDTDGDGIGDACDPAPTTPAAADADGDGFPNYADSCPFVKSIVDSDSDGISNECDPAPSVAGDGHGYADGFNDNDATQTATYSIPLAAGVVNGGAPVTFVDSNDNHIADSLETTIGCSDPKGSGLKACDSDGDGAPDASDADPLNPNDQGGNRLTKCAGDCEFDPNFPNFVGDGCKDTDPNEPHSSSTDPWKYYDVPAPALFAAPSPTTDFRLSGSLGAAMGQAVFGYFKKAAKLGTQLYDQDLNQNNVMDGVEYDRSLPGGILSGPDGVISSADAQKAFSQFKANIKCASGPAYRLNDSTTSN